MRLDSPRKRCIGALLIAALLAAGGCGQRGPLVLPGTPPETPASPDDTQEDDESETDSEP